MKKEWRHFQKVLLEKQSMLNSLVRKTEDSGREMDSQTEAMDLADKASSSYMKEFIFSKSSSERQLLQEVVDALKRMQEGSYGKCKGCGELVEQKRLKVLPWVALCLECQKKEEPRE